jgi:3-oxoacyl-[acyl-carrier-protein] synthase II
MQEEVAVTGLGIISAIGCSTKETLTALLTGKSGIGRIKHLVTEHSSAPIAEVRQNDDDLKQILDIKLSEIITRASLLGIHAIKEAIRQAMIIPENDLRIGLISGTTVGGMEKCERYFEDFLKNDDHKEYIDQYDCGACTEKIAEYFDIFNYISTISTACSSGANAIISGYNLIKNNLLDVVIAGGTECLSKYHINGFNSLMLLDPAHCRPFDDHRAGINLGEGAGYMVLESAEMAERRNVRILCKISGYGNACDAHHQTASSPEGKGAAIAITQALDMAGLKPHEIDYINAHGTGTINNDKSEARALLSIFGSNPPPFSSTKPYTGHTTSAAGSIEAVISILALMNGFIPPNLNFSYPMHDISLVPEIQLLKDIFLKNVMSNSFGFGGNNSVLIFSHH